MATTSLQKFMKKYSAEIKISVTISIAATFLSVISSLLIQYYNPRIIIDITIGIVIILLFLAILFNLKRLLMNFISNLPTAMVLQTEDFFRKDKYWERLGHFTSEKNLLAEVLVNKTLPKIIQNICKENPDMKTLNIILDSGTTITPIFKELICCGIHFDADSIQYNIYTNNLAGIDELHKIDPQICKIREREFNLIGGKPLNTYRATTGEPTQNFLKTIWDEQYQEENTGKIITLGILTSNWFTCGVGFKKISLCAKGEGHFEFKRDVIQNSHYSILISPLGKLLPLDDESLLNKLVPKEPDKQYRSFPIPAGKKDRIYLLTSIRPKDSLSPITNTSIRLKNLADDKIDTNYILCEDCPEFNPSGDRYGIVVSELPHQYIRDNFSKVFHEKPL